MTKGGHPSAHQICAYAWRREIQTNCKPVQHGICNIFTLVSSSPSGCDWRHPVGHGPVDVPAHRPQVGVPEAEDVRGAAREGPAPHLPLGECHREQREGGHCVHSKSTIVNLAGPNFTPSLMPC